MPKPPERVQYAIGVLDRRPDPDIQVSGRPGNTMRGQRMGAHDEEVNARRGQFGQDLGEVAVHRRDLP